MAKTISTNHQDLNAILINGDFVEHNIALDRYNRSQINKTWSLMKEIISDDMQMLRAEFGQVPLLPSIGNNDVIIHDKAPCMEIADQYYEELFDIWFPKDGPLPENFPYDEAKSTFIKGGFYSYDFPG